MEVNAEMVQQLADLSRLDFSDLEKKELCIDLQKMITFIEKLNELDTTNVKPLLHLTDDHNVFREDKVLPAVSREEALRNAPAATEEYFKVPKIIKK